MDTTIMGGFVFERSVFMNEKKPAFVMPVLIKEEKYQTASKEHCHQVKTNDCSYPLKA